MSMHDDVRHMLLQESGALISKRDELDFQHSVLENAADSIAELQEANARLIAEMTHLAAECDGIEGLGSAAIAARIRKAIAKASAA